MRCLEMWKSSSQIRNLSKATKINTNTETEMLSLENVTCRLLQQELGPVERWAKSKRHGQASPPSPSASEQPRRWTTRRTHAPSWSRSPASCPSPGRDAGEKKQIHWRGGKEAKAFPLMPLSSAVCGRVRTVNDDLLMSSTRKFNSS